jgi:hypothetical protein
MIFTSSQVDELKIGGYIDYTSTSLGLDSIDECFSRDHFKNFPHTVTYQFNSLGYREVDPSLYTKNPIITIGDSFTVGLGLPVELTYPKQLESLVQHQVLNFSLNGASNEWISRKLAILLKYFSPVAIIIHYTFSHRREKNEPTWFDDERTLCDPLPDSKDNFDNWLVNHNKIKSIVNTIPTYYSFIPNWHTETIQFDDPVILPHQVDYARDRFHYGETTSLALARAYADGINQQ